MTSNKIWQWALRILQKGRAAKKIWTTQLGLLNLIIIPKRYSCRHADAFYGLDNDSTCLKCCSRWVIVSLDLHFGDNCLLGSRNWPSLVDSLYGEESAVEWYCFPRPFPTWQQWLGPVREPFVYVTGAWSAYLSS